MSTEGAPSRKLGAPIIRMGAVTSTMDVIRHLEKLGAAEGTAVIAAAQTAGRGRAGRTWQSPDSAGLYCSILLRPALPIPQFQPFSIAAGLAICEALDPSASIGLRVKWPNDVLYENRKLAGILITTNISGSHIDSAVIGIGLNLLTTSSAPAHAVALSAIPGITSDRMQNPFPYIAQAIQRRYTALSSGNAKQALDGWERRLAYLGQAVSIEDGSETRSGHVRGIASDGALLIETETGHLRIDSGELVRGPRLAR